MKAVVIHAYYENRDTWGHLRLELLGTVHRQKLKLGAAELEHRKQCANAKARGVAPTFEKLEKWLRGIGSLIDGRIVIAEKVLEFVNKDYG